jgi:hypothetical protein
MKMPVTSSDRMSGTTAPEVTVEAARERATAIYKYVLTSSFAAFQILQRSKI